VYYINLYIYIYNTWKTIKTKLSVHTSLDIDMFFVHYVFLFFRNMAMSGCKRSTYRSIVFLKLWICRTGSDSMSVSSRDSIWDLGEYVDICLLFFFQHDVEKIESGSLWECAFW